MTYTYDVAQEQLREAWIVLAKRMTLDGFEAERVRITEATVQRRNDSDDKNWEPHYKWGMDEMRKILQKIHPMNAANEYDQVMADQEAYEKTNAN